MYNYFIRNMKSDNADTLYYLVHTYTSSDYIIAFIFYHDSMHFVMLHHLN